LYLAIAIFKYNIGSLIPLVEDQQGVKRKIALFFETSLCNGI
jgi:hypothetical protein